MLVRLEAIVRVVVVAAPQIGPSKRESVKQKHSGIFSIRNDTEGIGSQET
jgi:hypothetical protein